MSKSLFKGRMPTGLDIFLRRKYQLVGGSPRLNDFVSHFDTEESVNECNVQHIYPYLPTPSLGQDMTQGQFFKRSLTGLNSEFSFS